MTDLLALVLILIGFGTFIYNPTNIGYLVGALTALFVFVPFLIHEYLSADFIDYSMSQLTLVSNRVISTTKWYVVAIGAFWIAGAALGNGESFPRTQARTPRSRKLVEQRLLLLLIASWLVYGLAVLGSGLTILELFTPSQKYEIPFLESVYVQGLVIATPTLVACLIVSYRRRLDLLAIASLLSALMIALGTGQRRNVLVVALAFVVCLLLSLASRGAALTTERISAKLKRYVIIALPVLSLFGPVLWYARNYFTVLTATGQASLDVTLQVRGFFELFFGSAATAYPTTAMVVEMHRETYASLGSSFVFLLSSPIPRALWPGKPQSPASILVDYYNLDYSPSTFLVTEFVMNFALLGPLVALFFAYVLTKHGRWLLLTSDAVKAVAVVDPVRNQMFFAILFSQSILLFKNGFTLFVLNVAIWYAIAWGVVNFGTKRLINRDGPV